MDNETKKFSVNFWLLAAFGAVMSASVSLGVIYLLKANSVTAAKIAEIKEAKRPANVSAVVISDASCSDCFDLAPLFGALEKYNVKLSSPRTVERTSDEGKALIVKYNIGKLPVFILQGEVGKDVDLKKALASLGEFSENTFVLRQVGGPYVDAATGAVKGRTALILIGDSSCAGCYDVTAHETILRRFGLNPAVKLVDAGSAEGKALIGRYGIILVPAFVLTGEVKEYPALAQVWPQVGMIKNGAYVFSKGVPSMGVYKDLSAGKIIDPAASIATGTKKI